MYIVDPRGGDIELGNHLWCRLFQLGEGGLFGADHRIALVVLRYQERRAGGEAGVPRCQSPNALLAQLLPNWNFLPAPTGNR